MAPSPQQRQHRSLRGHAVAMDDWWEHVMSSKHFPSSRGACGWCLDSDVDSRHRREDPHAGGDTEMTSTWHKAICLHRPSQRWEEKGSEGPGLELRPWDKKQPGGKGQSQGRFTPIYKPHPPQPPRAAPPEGQCVNRGLKFSVGTGTPWAEA